MFFMIFLWIFTLFYTMHSKQVHNVYRFMYHYICKLRINLITQYFLVNTSISHRPGKYEYFPLFCQPCDNKQNISHKFGAFTVLSEVNTSHLYCKQLSALSHEVYNLQYSQRYSMINHCDRCITFLS